MTAASNNFPKLHNAMWPGLVGKGSDSEPAISLDKMIELTAAAEVDGQKFEGIDIFAADPHTNIDATVEDIKPLADKLHRLNLQVGSIVAPVWPPVGGGSAIGSEEERARFVENVRKACRIGAILRDLGVRKYGVIRIDTATGVDAWAADPVGNTKIMAKTFGAACDVAADYGEQLAAEGEICWGGMHGWKHMLDLLEQTDRKGIIGFQADMAHTLLYTQGFNAPEDRIVGANFNWDRDELSAALKTMTDALRPWTIDFHVAQNDATVKGMGSHDKTGRHCLPDDPNGKLDIVHDAGYWLRGADGQPTKAFHHICWDGCMFPNETMALPETWNSILAAMIKVREAHGWRE